LFFCSIPATNDYSALTWHRFIPVFANDGINSLYWHEIGATLVMLVVLHNSSVRTFFSGAFSRWLGRISFTLYLVHVPILCSFTSYLIIKTPSHNYYLLVALVGTISIAFTLAFATVFTWVADTTPTAISRKVGIAVEKLTATR
jgi:peptidoglycan/LPS O-acetylase OafA/YrhL